MSQEGCDLQKTLEKALQKMPTLGKYVAMRIKKTLSIVYLLLIALMALGTIVGKYTSVEMAADQFFGAWWFTLLWAVGVGLFHSTEGAASFVSAASSIVCCHLTGSVAHPFDREKGDCSSATRQACDNLFHKDG